MNIIAWIVFGLIVGLVAYYIDPASKKAGLVGTTILGILGALLGGFLGSLLFGVGITGFDLSSFIVAVIGALVLLFVGRTFTRGA